MRATIQAFRRALRAGDYDAMLRLVVDLVDEGSLESVGLSHEIRHGLFLACRFNAPERLHGAERARVWSGVSGIIAGWSGRHVAMNSGESRYLNPLKMWMVLHRNEPVRRKLLMMGWSNGPKKDPTAIIHKLSGSYWRPGKIICTPKVPPLYPELDTPQELKDSRESDQDAIDRIYRDPHMEQRR